MQKKSINIGILGSTRGSNLSALVEAIQSGELPANISVVISNKLAAPILQRAILNDLPCEFVDPMGLSRCEYDKRVSALLHTHKVELVVFIGYMRIVSPEFINEWHNRLINVHPSLLPLYAGMMDLEVHRAVLAAGATETGCTVHHVTERVDEGPIILQLKCPVFLGDTPEVLKSRVQRLEKQALVAAIRMVWGGDV